MELSDRLLTSNVEGPAGFTRTRFREALAAFAEREYAKNREMVTRDLDSYRCIAVMLVAEKQRQEPDGCGNEQYAFHLRLHVADCARGAMYLCMPDGPLMHSSRRAHTGTAALRCQPECRPNGRRFRWEFAFANHRALRS